MGRFVTEVGPHLSPKNGPQSASEGPTAVSGASSERLGASWAPYIVHLAKQSTLGTPNCPQIAPNSPKHDLTRVRVCDDIMTSTCQTPVENLPNHATNNVCVWCVSFPSPQHIKRLKQLSKTRYAPQGVGGIRRSLIIPRPGPITMKRCMKRPIKCLWNGGA